MRFYRFTPDAYELYRDTLDAAMGFPCPGTATSIEPIGTAPRDAGGNVLLGVSGEWLAPAEAEEITAEQYHLQINTPQP
jgi:hypothetical protein